MLQLSVRFGGALLLLQVAHLDPGGSSVRRSRRPRIKVCRQVGAADAQRVHPTKQGEPWPEIGLWTRNHRGSSKMTEMPTSAPGDRPARPISARSIFGWVIIQPLFPRLSAGGG